MPMSSAPPRGAPPDLPVIPNRLLLKRYSGSRFSYKFPKGGLIGGVLPPGTAEEDIMRLVGRDAILAVFQQDLPDAVDARLDHDEAGGWIYWSAGRREVLLHLSGDEIRRRIAAASSLDGSLRIQIVVNFETADLEYMANDAFLSRHLTHTHRLQLQRATNSRIVQRATTRTAPSANRGRQPRRQSRRFATRSTTSSSSRDDGGGSDPPPAPPSSPWPRCSAREDRDRTSSHPEPGLLAGTEFLEIGSTLVPRRVFLDSTDVIIARGGAS